MKKILILTITCLISINSHAQNKFGYIDSQELLILMPERDKALKELQDYEQSLKTTLESMINEGQQLLQEYQNLPDNTPELERKDKEIELQALEERIQMFQQGANEKLQDRNLKLTQPILQTINTAIQEVAVEGGYTYIFDKSFGNILYAKDSENILEKVKKKLKL